MARQDMAGRETVGTGVGAGGNPENYLHLGICYSTGRDVPLDLVEAHKWFNIAALNGLRAAASYRREVAEHMNAAQIRKAQQRARAWLGRG